MAFHGWRASLYRNLGGFVSGRTDEGASQWVYAGRNKNSRVTRHTASGGRFNRGQLLRIRFIRQPQDMAFMPDDFLSIV